MQFVIKRDTLLKSLNFVQGIVEKKNTLPILSNVLIQLKNKKLSIIATDLDIVFYDEITDVKVLNENLPSSKNPPSAVFIVACWFSLDKPLSSIGGNWTSSTWKFLSGFTKPTITLLYLSFFVGIDKLYPPIISSSVSVIDAVPVVSIINLYLPPV